MKYKLLYLFISLAVNYGYANNIFNSFQYLDKKDSVNINCEDSSSFSATDLKQYDCRSQSYFTSLSQGDSLNLTFIAYSNQDFRIMVYAQSNLGILNFKIVEPERENIYKVKKVNENEEVIFKIDEYGEQVLGSDDKPIILSKEILRDTIWDKNIIIHEKVIFDSENNTGAKYFDINNIERTHRLIIKLKVNGTDMNIKGCIGILIGRKYSNPFNVTHKK